MAKNNNGKYYMSETIVFSNDDYAFAKNLPISKLRLFHKTMDKWNDHIEKLQRDSKELDAKAAEIAEKDGRDVEEVRDELGREYDKENKDGLTFVDVAVECALIALQTWHVRSETGKTIEPENIDTDYIESTLDMPTINRIISIAGAMDVGDIEKLEGKA